MGFRPSLDYINETYGGEWVEAKAEEPEPPEAGSPDANPGKQAQEAETADLADPQDPPQVSDVLADNLANEAAPAVESWLSELRSQIDDAVDKGTSLEQLRDQLLTAYGDLPTEDLAKVMQLGFATAELAGRFDVSTESR
ncbi:MAG: hypothetical protein ACWA5X_10355 [bacterium]